MSRTLRSKRLRSALWIAADGKCQLCGCDLPDDWHADHVVPWSARPITNVHEMQALCPTCNLRKGATVADRQHQVDLREKISRIDASDLPLKVLMWVIAGGGKSRLPGIMAQKFQKFKIGWFVPRLTLQTQAIEALGRDFDIVLRDSGNDIDPSRGTRGFVATHNALCRQPELWRDEFRRNPYVLIVDEPHHAKIEKDDEGKKLAESLSVLSPKVSLYMSGTLETNDNSRIFGLHYEPIRGGHQLIPERSADIYIRYDRQTALRERAIVPIEFLHHDGPVKWKRGTGEEKENRLSDVSKEDESAAIFTALNTEIAIQLFENGLDHWRKYAGKGKLIVVTDSQARAREYAKRLKAAGITAALAIDDNPTAHDEVRRFRHDKSVSAIVTCQMAYEGLDVVWATHLICLTHIRSAPWIEQMLARIWRFAVGKNRCWAFVPDDPRMKKAIERIQAEQAPFIRDWGICGPGGPGGVRESVLALNGNVDLVHQKFLDEQFASDEIREKLINLVSDCGISSDEPEVQALLSRLAMPKIPQQVVRTTKEVEKEICKQIADECCSIDGAHARLEGREPRFGDTQKELIRITGKSIRDMTIEELKRAHSQLQSLRPR